MQPLAQRRDVRTATPRYERHNPEHTLLYQIIERHYPVFRHLMSEQGKELPMYIQQEFSDYLKCGRLEYGFLRVQCTSCHKENLVAFSCKRRGFCPSCGARRMAESAALLVDDVIPELPVRQWVLSFPFQLRFLFASDPKVMGKVLGIVCRAIATHLIRKAGFARKTADAGAITLIQRFGSALNLNVHFHMLFLDGVYTTNKHGKTVFRRTNGPDERELDQLLHTISRRVAGYLERQGLLERDEENSYLQLDHLQEDPMQQFIGHSVTYRVAIGKQSGQKVFSLQTLPASNSHHDNAQVAKASGFSLHAGVSAQAWEREKLERLCRYITRPAVSEKHLSLTPAGNIRYQLKNPYRNGTTHLVFEPLDFLSKLAALVPKPRVNLIRYHGVFAPNSPYRSSVTPAGKAMTWAQRLKRVFGIDIEVCDYCAGSVKVIACIEDKAVIEQILGHLKRKGDLPELVSLLPDSTGPPYKTIIV